LTPNAALDSDGDGVTNVEEGELVTDPTYPNDTQNSETTSETIHESEEEVGFIPGFFLEMGLPLL